MPAEPPSLDDLRREIDEIDIAIHDLLMRRTEIGRRFGAAKGDDSVYFRPGREAQILRRLVARHRGPLPAAVLVRVWREFIGALTALQGPFTIAVSASSDGPNLDRLASDHYGSQTPITSYESNMGVLRAVAERLATVGVLPLPRSDDQDPWWRHLAREGESTPRIIARLPFASREGRAGEVEALAVAMAAQEESGKDRSYLILETAHQLSRATMKSFLIEAGLRVVDVQTCSNEPNRRLHLIEVEGYLPAQDPRLAELAGGDEESLGSVWSIGGYAVPLSIGELEAADARSGET